MNDLIKNAGEYSVALVHDVATYGRGITVFLRREGRCNCCGRDGVPVIVTDTSDGEYGEASLCRECTDRIFALLGSPE